MDYQYVGSGGFGLCGSGSVDSQLTYDFEMPFLWQTENIIDIEMSFEWAVGEQALRWFQVNSSPKPPSQDDSGCGNCPNPQGASPQCQMNYIAATKVSEVCTQLAQTGFTGTIGSIKVIDPPIADRTRPSPPTTCTEVPFKNVPECLEFSLQSSPVVTMVVTVTGGQAFGNFYTGFGGVSLGGSALITSSIFGPPILYTGSGGITMGGSGDADFTMSYSPSDSCLADLSLGGGAIISFIGATYHYVGSGGMGMAGVAMFPIVGSGGMALGGSGGFLSPDWHYTGTGGIGMSGVTSYIGVGGMVLGGGAFVGTTYEYVGSGSMTLGGGGSFTSPDWHYTGVGGMTLAGSATARSNYYDLSDSWVVEVSVPFMEADFTIEQGTTLVAPLETIRTDCGCNALPLTLLFQSNFGSTNVFSNFLQRNGLTLPTSQPLFYNRRFSAWQQNLHITGVGETSQTEQWDITFEWTCSNQLADQDTGQNYWQFLANFVRRNMVSGARQVSKVMVIMDSSGLCADPNRFGVSFTLNTLTGITLIQSPASLELQVLNDEIGLFQGLWNLSPVLRVTIALVPQTRPFNFIDGTVLLLRTPSIFV